MALGSVRRRDKLYVLKSAARTTAHKFQQSKVNNRFANLPLKKFKVIIIGILSITIVLTAFSSIQSIVNNYYVKAQIEDNSNTLNIQTPNISQGNGEVLGSTTKDFTSTSNATYKDKRAYVLDMYFKQFDSPLEGYGQVFVDACDKYGAPKECVIVPAIAFNETHLCKYPGSAEMYNCWGWGGPGVYRRTFSSYEEAIDTVTQVIVQQYGNRFIEDPTYAEATFCGNLEPECNGWGRDIKYFMSNIRQFSKDLGVIMGE